MLPYFFGDEQFFGVKERAANIATGKGAYTAAMFQADFPQFYRKGTDEGEEVTFTPFLPQSILDELIKQANAAVQPDRWLDGWRYSAGLYVAHYVTMYLRNYSENPQTPAQAAATGSVSGLVKSATLGDSSVSYDTTAVSEALKEWGDFNATSYGQQFATRARLVGMGGMGII